MIDAVTPLPPLTAVTPLPWRYLSGGCAGDCSVEGRIFQKRGYRGNGRDNENRSERLQRNRGGNGGRLRWGYAEEFDDLNRRIRERYLEIVIERARRESTVTPQLASLTVDAPDRPGEGVL